MSSIGYYNGQIGKLSDMRIPMLDRSVYFGDGCYEACLAHGDKGFGLEEHLDRFEKSMNLLRIAPPCSRAEMKKTLKECVEASGEDLTVLYWQCTRCTAPRKHCFPDASVPSNLMVMVTPKKMSPRHAKVRLITAEDIRFTMCNIKTLNLLPNVLISERAAEAGADEAVLIRDGIVTEGTRSNVMILKDGALITHPADNLILSGITRGRTLGICGRLGIPYEEKPFTREELFSADEILISSSTEGIRSATEIDGVPAGRKDEKTLLLIQDAYDLEVYGEML